MLQPEVQTSWTLRDGMPLSGDAALDVLHARVLTQPPERADVIVWLQGNRYARGSKALALWQAGYAPTIVCTGTDARTDEAHPHDGVRMTMADLRQWLLDRGVPASAITVDDRAFHTGTQASNTIALAQRRGWQTLLLVASPHHQLRAFLTFVRAAERAGWHGHIVNQPADIPWDAVPSGRTQSSAACFVEEAVKIAAYGDDVASVRAGIAALDSAQNPAHDREV